MLFTKEERVGLLIIGISMLAGSFLLSKREDKVVEELIIFPDKVESVSDETSLKDTSVNRRLDVNSATQEELQSIPGIGPKLANAIVERRKIKRFSDINELLEIKGIGQKKLQSISRYLEVK